MKATSGDALLKLNEDLVLVDERVGRIASALGDCCDCLGVVFQRPVFMVSC
jgi:hypothetical protein